MTTSTTKIKISLPSLRSMLIIGFIVAGAVFQTHFRLVKHFAEQSYHHFQYSTTATVGCGTTTNQLADLPRQQQQLRLQAAAVTTKETSATRQRQPAPLTSSTSSSSGLHAFNSSTLPLQNENGIIIFYLHIPKTGGTSMMAPFVQHPEWRYRMVYGYGKQARYAKEMYSWLENWEPGTKVFYEYHAGKASPYMEMQVRQDLLVWRAMAKVRNIPFFAFTVVREPLSMAVSHFNFYYASPKEDPRYFWRPEATEADFMELSVPNPQCLFLVKSEVAYYEDYRRKGNSIETTSQQCEDVYDAFVNDLDWVGTTEGLTKETFPILEQLGQIRYCPEIRNRSFGRIHKKTLSEEALQFVRRTTSFDKSIYERAQRDYPIQMWNNFDPPKGPAPVHPRKKVCVYKKGQALPPGELPKRAGERRRFLENNPGFVEVKDME